MGAQVSMASSNTEIITKAINDVIIRSSKACSADSIQNQKQHIGGDVTGDGNDFSMVQASNIDLSCLQQNMSTSDLRNKIKQEILNKLKSGNEGQNIGLQTSISHASTKLVNEIVNKISISDLQDCHANNTQYQDRIIDGNVSGNKNIFTMNQASNIVATCTQENTSMVEAINDLATSVTNDISASNVGFIGGGAAVLVLILILIIIGIYLSKKKPKPSS